MEADGEGLEHMSNAKRDQSMHQSKTAKQDILGDEEEKELWARGDLGWG